MTAAFKTAVNTGSDTQLTKVTLYIGDIGKAWDVQVREIAQGREELFPLYGMLVHCRVTPQH